MQSTVDSTRSYAFFDPKIEEFLEGKNPGTRSIYRAGLLAFQEFYQPQGSISDFLDRLEADRNLGWRQKKGVASIVIRNYVAWLQTEKLFKRKTVRVYVAAIQQLAKKCDVPFLTNDVHLPASNPVLKKYAWTLDDVVRYLSFFESPMYRSMGVLIFQSFMDSSTALSLQYRDIQKEYEAGIVPLCIDTERVKSDIPFMTFIGKWGVKELHKWLDSRDDISPRDSRFSQHPRFQSAITSVRKRNSFLVLSSRRMNVHHVARTVLGLGIDASKRQHNWKQ
jgi:integrase